MGHLPFTPIQSSLKAVRATLRRFASSEHGGWTIEACIWTPMLVLFTAFSTNMSLVFFQEAQILDELQLATREWALGRHVDASAVETAIANQLSYLDASLQIDASSGDGLVTASVVFSAAEMMPINFMTAPFANIMIEVESSQFIEY